MGKFVSIIVLSWIVAMILAGCRGDAIRYPSDESEITGESLTDNPPERTRLGALLAAKSFAPPGHRTASA